jgi:hypothetical protein
MMSGTIHGDHPTFDMFGMFGVSTFETVWGFRLEEGFGLIAVTWERR